MNDATSLRCELCKSVMSCATPPGKAIRYYHCARCGRWVASSYGEELLRSRTARVEAPKAAARYDLERIKQRLARWLEDLDERDPYFVLGLPPSSSEEVVHARFKELALENHPDRGGDPALMRRILNAYDQIRSTRQLSEPEREVEVFLARAALRKRT